MNVKCEILSYKVILNISGGLSVNLEVSVILSAHRHDTIAEFSSHSSPIFNVPYDVFQHDCDFKSNLLMELLGSAR